MLVRVGNFATSTQLPINVSLSLSLSQGTRSSR